MSRTITLIYGIFSMLAMCFLHCILYAFIAWVISLTFLGTWINEVIVAVVRTPIELYKVGALIGFVRAMRWKVLIPFSKDISRALEENRYARFIR